MYIVSMGIHVNYVFVRHGQGCHNAIKTLYNKGQISRAVLNEFNTSRYFDPELTEVGVNVSMHNGSIISQILSRIKGLESINVVGCSPLIRCMETAYYMTRTWANPPKKIYVFPFLREIDESSNNKYSQESLVVIDSTSSYAMKSIDEQKAYLQSIGILQYFDFSFVENFSHGRKSPGDIEMFIGWFSRSFLPLIPSVNKLNVFITTHAGVLRDFSDMGYVNNSGFIVHTKAEGGRVESSGFTDLTNLLPSSFFMDYSIIEHSSTYSSKTRCSILQKRNL